MIPLELLVGLLLCEVPVEVTNIQGFQLKKQTTQNELKNFLKRKKPTFEGILYL